MKYYVKCRQVITKEYTIEVEASSATEAMEESQFKFNPHLPDWCYFITKGKWFPVSVEVKEKENE